MILPIYAAFLACLYIALSVRIVIMRRGMKIAVGDGGDSRMLRAIRAHSNFAEYVPFALLLIYLAEVLSAPHVLIHALGIIFCVGRVSHAFGISRPRENFKFRIFGMVTTFTTLGIAAGYIVFASL